MDRDDYVTINLKREHLHLIGLKKNSKGKTVARVIREKLGMPLPNKNHIRSELIAELGIDKSLTPNKQYKQMIDKIRELKKLK